MTGVYSHLMMTFLSIKNAASAFAAGCTLFAACSDISLRSPAASHRLTVLAGAGGVITIPSSTTVSVADSGTIAVKASANPGYVFLKWTNATECASIGYKNAASTTVRLLSGDDTVQAVFVQAVSDLKPVSMAPLGRLERGISYQYYTGSWMSLPDFSSLEPKQSDSCGSFDLAGVPHRQTGFGIVFSGYLDIPYSGDYAFYVKSSDGSALLLNDSVLINNDGVHQDPGEDSATASLEVGKYRITVLYFTANSSPVCTVSYACPSIGIEKQVVATGILSRPFTGPVSKIIITKPVGGDIYRPGDSLHVRWIYRHFDHMVFCEISRDNGKGYAMLSVNAFAHTDTNGFLDWKIPDGDSMITDQARIRVRDYPPGVNVCVSDIFSIDTSVSAFR
jgi:hypothetical protein